MLVAKLDFVAIMENLKKYNFFFFLNVAIKKAVQNEFSHITNTHVQCVPYRIIIRQSAFVKYNIGRQDMH